MKKILMLFELSVVGLGILLKPKFLMFRETLFEFFNQLDFTNQYFMYTLYAYMLLVGPILTLSICFGNLSGYRNSKRARNDRDNYDYNYGSHYTDTFVTFSIMISAFMKGFLYLTIFLPITITYFIVSVIKARSNPYAFDWLFNMGEGYFGF